MHHDIQCHITTEADLDYHAVINDNNNNLRNEVDGKIQVSCVSY